MSRRRRSEFSEAFWYMFGMIMGEAAGCLTLALVVILVLALVQWLW